MREDDALSHILFSCQDLILPYFMVSVPMGLLRVTFFANTAGMTSPK